MAGLSLINKKKRLYSILKGTLIILGDKVFPHNNNKKSKPENITKPYRAIEPESKKAK